MHLEICETILFKLGVAIDTNVLYILILFQLILTSIME